MLEHRQWPLGWQETRRRSGVVASLDPKTRFMTTGVDITSGTATYRVPLILFSEMQGHSTR